MSITASEISKRFAPPKVDAERAAIKARLSAKAGELAELVHELVPGSREESEAITHIEIALGWAHAGVDRRYVTRDERRTVPTANEAIANLRENLPARAI